MTGRALTVGVSLPKLVGEIKSAWRELQKTERSADALYQEIGVMLSKARAQVLLEKKETWTAFMERNFSDLGIRRSRAYELMAVADKKTTVAKVRERKSTSMRKTREKLPPRGGQQAGGAISLKPLSSSKALAEFRIACDSLLPLLNERDQIEAYQHADEVIEEIPEPDRKRRREGISLNKMMAEAYPEGCDTAELQWQFSAENHLAALTSLTAYWDRIFKKKWRQYGITAELLALACGQRVADPNRAFQTRGRRHSADFRCRDRQHAGRHHHHRTGGVKLASVGQPSPDHLAQRSNYDDE
jgi:hypothetical protein